MNTIKRSFALSIALLLASVVLLAEPASPRRYSNRLMNDVVQMTRAGLSDSTIIAYVKARRSRLADVTAEDLITLRQQGVSEPVVAYVAGTAGIQGDYDREAQMNYESDEGDTTAVEPSYPVDGYDGYDGYYAYGYPYWYAWGYPYGYGYWPGFSTGVFIGGRFGGFHGGFRGGHGGGGHRGGHGGGGRGGRH